MAEGELPTSYSQTRVMNAPPAVSTVSLVSTTTIVQLPPTATATLSGGRFRLTSATPLEAWCFLQGGQDGLRRRCRHSQCVYRAIRACFTQYSTVCTARTSPSLKQPDSLGRVLPAGGNTHQNTRGEWGEGEKMGGGDANKPGECD